MAEDSQKVRHSKNVQRKVGQILTNAWQGKHADHAEQEQRALAEALRDTAAALNSTLDFDEILEHILTNVGRVVPHDSANIMLIESGVARVARCRGYAERGLDAAIKALGLTVSEIPNLTQMTETRQPLLIPNAHTDPRWVNFEESDWIGSYVAAPICVKERVIGFLNLDAATPDFFTPIHAARLQAFADQAAVALENARLLAETERRAERLTLLNRIAQTVSRTLDPDELLEIVYQEIKQVMEAEAFFIALYDPTSNALEYPISIDRGARDSIARRPLTTGLAAHVVTSKRPLLVRDYGRERADLPPVNLWGAKELPQSWLGVPMLLADRVVGVICVQAYHRGAYDSTEVELLSTIADTVAVALDNARLYTEARQHAAAMEALTQVGQKLTAALDMDEIIEHLAGEIGHLLQPGNLALDLYDEESKEIEVKLYLDRGKRKTGFRRPLGRDLVSQVITKKEAILATDYATECRKQGLPDSGETAKAWLGVPLLAGEKVLGALRVWDDEAEGSLRERDARVVSTLAAQVAVAIENARLYGAEQASLAMTTRLYELSGQFLGATTVEETAQIVIQTLRDGFAADAAWLHMLDEQGRLEFSKRVGLGLEPADARQQPVGLTMQVWKSGQLTIVVDPDLLDPAARAEGILTAVVFPLRGETRNIGVLTLDYRRARGFTEAEVQLLSLFANQAALALERVNRGAETRQRIAELEAVNKISSALRVVQTVDEMLPLLLDETLDVLGASAASIWLYDASKGELRQGAVQGFPDMKLGLRVGEGIAGQVFATGEPYLSSDFKSDPLTHPSARERVPAGLSGAAVPIRTAHAIVGVLFVSVQQPRQLSASTVRILSIIAEIAGNAIHRTRLHEETERRLQHLAALHYIDNTITGSLDLNLALQVILNQAITQLGVDAADILMLDPHTQTLAYVDGVGFRTTSVKSIRLRMREGYAGQVAFERRILTISNLPEIGKTAMNTPLIVDEGFVTYVGVPLIARGQVKGVLEVFHRTAVDPTPEWLEFLETLAGQTAIAIDKTELFNGLQRSNLDLTLAYDTTIEGWSRALDLRDKETEGHTQRVGEMTLRLARAMGVSSPELVHTHRGALLHDIGKVGIPDSILLKPGSLTEEEWAIMRKHPVYAYELLSPIAYLRPALDIPYCHHEKWDGSGYPRGLRGEQIPLAARIFAVVDVWDALRSDRPYRQAWSEEEARKHIRAGAGTHFDPQVVETFLRILEEESSSTHAGEKQWGRNGAQSAQMA